GWLVEQSRKIAKISAFGIDLELTQEGARKVQEATESTFGDLRKHIITEFDRLVRAGKIDQKLELLVESRVKPLLKQHGLGSLDFRCTIHVADVLYTETLYQLLDYYPSGDGRGRTFSIRFGIVGKTWRLQGDQVEPVISSDAAKLIESWGMTVRETSGSGQGRRSYASILLKDSDQTGLAVVYLDSPTDNAFGANMNRKRQIIGTVHRAADLARIRPSLTPGMDSCHRREEWACRRHRYTTAQEDPSAMSRFQAASSDACWPRSCFRDRPVALTSDSHRTSKRALVVPRQDPYPPGTCSAST
ncbi:MAG: hypothetical protein ACRD1T_05165, partial [Acidimicrobiia bacterium]